MLLEPLNLWQFVMAAIGNRCNSLQGPPRPVSVSLYDLIACHPLPCSLCPGYLCPWFVCRTRWILPEGFCTSYSWPITSFPRSSELAAHPLDFWKLLKRATSPRHFLICVLSSDQLLLGSEIVLIISLLSLYFPFPPDRYHQNTNFMKSGTQSVMFTQ